MPNRNNPRAGSGDFPEDDGMHRRPGHGDDAGDPAEYDDFDELLDEELAAALENDPDAAFDFADDETDADLEDDLDDDLDDDLLDLRRQDEDEGDLDDDLAALAEYFPDNDFRIVDLKDLAALDDLEDTGLPPIAPTFSLEEVLYNLVRDARNVPNNELAVFSDLSRAGADETSRVWPHIELIRRRAVVAGILELADVFFDLDFSTFLRIPLDDPDSVVRQLAVQGLGDEPASDLLGRLVQMLEADEDVGVRAAAASALGPYVLEGELEELDSALAMRAEQALMGVLTNRGEPLEVQCRALESIAYSGELGVRQLIEDAYYSANEERRLSSLVAMGRSADVRWRRLAHAELTNPSAAMRAQAAVACGELEAKAALPDLLRLLVDEDANVRLAAIFALGHIGGSRARQALQAIANGEDEAEAFAADQALEEMDFYAGEAAAQAPLFDEADDDDRDWDSPTPFRDIDDDEDLGEYA